MIKGTPVLLYSIYKQLKFDVTWDGLVKIKNDHIFHLKCISEGIQKSNAVI